MTRLIMLAIGGALGTLARYGINGLISDQQTQRLGLAAIFPLGTMVANVTGCFVIGLLAAVTGPSLGRAWLSPAQRDFLIIGFCGGYTTFSSFALQTLNLARDGEWFYVAANVIGSNIIGFAAVYLGWVVGRLAQARLQGGSL